ncbi:unnamed protein product [Calypogeia fissa]
MQKPPKEKQILKPLKEKRFIQDQKQMPVKEKIVKERINPDEKQMQKIVKDKTLRSRVAKEAPVKERSLVTTERPALPLKDGLAEAILADEIQLDFDGGDSYKINQKKLVAGEEKLKEHQRWYPFGIDEYFRIPVDLIDAAPVHMNERAMNHSHVAEIFKNMMVDTPQEPLPADVVPYLTNQDNTYELVTAKKGFRIEKYRYFAISGQHSSLAFRRIVEQATIDALMRSRADFLSLWRCRIFSGSTPFCILVEILASHNNQSRIYSFQSPYIDMVQHARKQYFDMQCPLCPTKGKKKSADFIVMPLFSSCYFILYLQIIARFIFVSK